MPTPTTSPILPTHINNAQEAGDTVIALARWGAANGSYAIASILVENSTGKIVGAMANSVDRILSSEAVVAAGQPFPYDPTAHGERKMTYWYYENRDRLSLPAPQALTLITSLDPCAMCTGTVLRAGFNVGVFAIDPYAGINYNSSGKFTDLPQPLRGQALERFGYYAAEGGRSYQGGPSVAFNRTSVNAATLDECSTAYEESADVVRASRADADVDPSQLSDPANDPAIRAAFRRRSPSAFELKMANKNTPDAALEAMLRDLISSAPQATGAAAFIDPFGNVVAAFADSFATNPVATALENTVQAYSQTRFELMNKKVTSASANKTLTSPVEGTFVLLNAPSPRVATSFADLGAYGATFASAPSGKEPSPFRYYEPPLQGTTQELRTVIAGMPPLYSQHVKINPERVS